MGGAFLLLALLFFRMYAKTKAKKTNDMAVYCKSMKRLKWFVLEVAVMHLFYSAGRAFLKLIDHFKYNEFYKEMGYPHHIDVWAYFTYAICSFAILIGAFFIISYLIKNAEKKLNPKTEE